MHLHRPSIDSTMSPTPGLAITEEPIPATPTDPSTDTTPLLLHDNHPPHSHGHAHGSMNMQALVLHVLGDALGNVGVIATGLIIWKSTWEFKYYCDPVISLIITVIIFSSALPLGEYHISRVHACLLTSPSSQKRFLHPFARCAVNRIPTTSQRLHSSCGWRLVSP